MNEIDLKNRVAVVTGAGQGIGLAIARRLAESILSKQPAFGFLRFGAGAIGWEYGEHIEEWRRHFAKHLETFIAQYMNKTEEVPAELRRKLSEAGLTINSDGHILSGIRNTLAVYGLNIRKLRICPSQE